MRPSTLKWVTRCCVTFQLFMWSTNPQEFGFLHFTINTMKDRSRRHLDYSGITCSECPFLNLTWSPITNTLPGKAEHLKNTTTSGILTCLNIFFYLITEIFRGFVTKTLKPAVILPQINPSDSSHSWAENSFWILSSSPTPQINKVDLSLLSCLINK